LARALPLTLILGLLSSSARAECPEWSYDDSKGNGPSMWGDLCPEYAACKTEYQSPIELSNPTHVIEAEVAASLNYSYVVANKATFANTRYTFEASDLGNGNNISFPGLLPFNLVEFHFHVPSEHTKNGQHFPMELHMLHIDAEENRAVLVLVYSVGDDNANNPFLESLSSYLPNIPYDEDDVEISSVDIASQVNLVPGYYHYEGSTTTPPCFGGVQWFVARQPIPVSPSVLSKFSSIHNARPVQKLDAREVSLFTPGIVYVPRAPTWIVALSVLGIGMLLLAVVVALTRTAHRQQAARSRVVMDDVEFEEFLGGPHPANHHEPSPATGSLNTDHAPSATAVGSLNAALGSLNIAKVGSPSAATAAGSSRASPPPGAWNSGPSVLGSLNADPHE